MRRAFLAGEDRYTGKNFNHRRGWIETRIRQLADVFAIDIGGYAVMSNHYHIITRLAPERASEWTVDEVMERWCRIFTGPLLVQRYRNAAIRPQMSQPEVDKVMEIVATWRIRLSDLSWFMRILNETVARAANAEDGIHGRFWEGRFKSQALLDEQALLSALVYVDLNPIRAGIAETPETSEYTSVHARLTEAEMPHTCKAEVPATIEAPVADIVQMIQMLGETRSADITLIQPATVTRMLALADESALAKLPLAPLMPFDGTARMETAVPFSWPDYLELVDCVGRAVHPHKKGFIPAHTPKILDRLNLDMKTFISHASRFLKEFGSAVGTPDNLIRLAAARQMKYLRGIGAARQMFERHQKRN